MTTAAREGEAPVTGASYTGFLAQLPFFVGVPAEDLSAFANTVLVRELPAKTDIVVQRQYGHAMFVIVSGAVAIHAIGPDDDTVQLGRLERPGEFFGEAVLLGRGERTATVTSETPVVLLEIEKHRFDLLTRRHRSVREHLEGVYHARAISTYLRTHRYLSLLGAPARTELGRGARLKLYQRGDAVTRKGDPADSVLVIKDGVVKATRVANGAVSILAYFNTHDVVGVADGGVRDFGLEAVGQCEVIFLPRNTFAMMMMQHGDVARHFGKDDMHRRAAMAGVGGTVMQAAQAFLSAGVEVESLLVINLDRCVRCGNCVRACHARHTYTRLDRRGPIFRRRAKIDGRRHEHIMLPSSCRHCRDPECMIGCPTGAIQRFADGDVDINDNCIGCENCARKCPYGNITMRPLDENERPSPEITKRAIKCNLCRGYGYSNCVHECPRGAILRVDPLRYFEELALVMEAEQRDAIEWSRGQAEQLGLLGTKQHVRPRSTWFIPASLVLGIVAIAAIVAAAVWARAPLRGGSAVGLPLGIAAATCLGAAASLGVRKRMRDTAIGGLEAWTQFHMVLGAIGFLAAVAHAGFQVTGVFTTMLLLVFAFEVATGVAGQLIYATVPTTLTRLERHGLARLVEDLHDEQAALERSIGELVATVHPRAWRALRKDVEALAGDMHLRMTSSYDPPGLVNTAKQRLGAVLKAHQLTADDRAALERVVESRCRLLDVRAQLLLHHRLKVWLVLHVATATALVVLLGFHIVTALTLVGVMPLRLSFDTGALAGIHVVTSAPTIRLGRDPQVNDILLTNPKVSRKHAVIERSVRGGYSLEVLGTGPSQLNGDPVAAVGGRPTVHPLSTGDHLAFGGIELTVSEATVTLIAVSGPSVGRELAIDGTVRVGSGHDCDLVLDDPAVEPEHLVIASTPLGFRAEPRAAMSINGAPGEVRVLSHGDELVLGATTLRFTAQSLEDVSADASMSSTLIAGAVTDPVGELVVLAGTSKGERIPLGNEQIILGTRADCTVMLSDILASPLHCAISKNGDELVATDLGSEAGTFINGERITRGTALKPGDLIAIGIHVLEARLIGGVTIATKGSTIFTTLVSGGGYGAEPRFVLEARVVKAARIAIGRAPSCDVTIDHPAVSREHCVIEWADGFTIRDRSTAGTYVNDKRIVQQLLPPSSVLRILDTLFRVAVRGEVCTIERADAALAEAALDVARQHASFLTRNVQGADLGAAGPMKTLFRMDLGALEHEISARKKDLRRGAPAWRPSSDLARNRPMRGAVVLSVLAAIALCGGAMMFRKGDTLVNHPLSAAHASKAFVGKARGSTVCGACHSAGARVDSASCAGCHDGFGPRHAHEAVACARCHREHKGGPPDHALHAQAGCATCHPRQHAGDFVSGGAVPQQLAAGPLPDVRLDPVALHAAHSRVVLAGRPVGIGCTACHGKLAGGALTQARPGLACFRCHDGGAEATTTGCARCHAREHTRAMPPMAPDDPGRKPAIVMPTPLGSIGWAFGIALVGSAPGLLFGGWLRLRRRRTSAAMVDDLRAHPAEVVKRLVHSINDSKCVGCGLCVQACPASVLELVEHKSRVVNFDSCIQCKKCETACAFDALRMHDADKPPPMIPMPSIDAFHETPVAGMYLIGQASGTPQVKNATNLGRAVIQRIVQQGARPGIGRDAGCDVDIAIVGSGPAGLSAALTCIELGLSYVLLEKERAFAWTIRNYYHKGKEVMAEPHDVALEATLPHWDTSREELLGAWQALIEQHRLAIRYQHNVLDVKPDGGRFTLSLGDPKDKPIGQLTAARVVIAIGTLGNPRKLGCPGDELEKVKNSLVDPDEWIGKAIMVVGGSDSAVEVVLALSAPERRNRVWFSTRGAKLEGIKPKNRKLIEDALAAGRFQIRYATQIADVTPTGVGLTYKEDGRREDLPNDVVFAMIGGNSPQKWLQQIGIPYVDKPHSWSPPRTDLISQKTAEGLISVQRLVRGKLGLH